MIKTIFSFVLKLTNHQKQFYNVDNLIIKNIVVKNMFKFN